MVRLLAACTGGIFLLAAVAFAAPPMAEQVVWGGAIGRLEDEDGGFHCTFFLISRRTPDRSGYRGMYDYYGPSIYNYLLVSNGHCHTNDLFARIGRQRYRINSLGYASIEYGVDLMLGTFTTPEKWRTLQINENPPVPGTFVRFAGFPHGVFRSTVAQVLRIDHNEFGREAIFIDVALSPGASGSPIMDLETGKVVGVVNLRTLPPGSWGCGFVPCRSLPPGKAIPIKELRAFINLSKMPPDSE